MQTLLGAAAAAPQPAQATPYTDGGGGSSFWPSALPQQPVPAMPGFFQLPSAPASGGGGLDPGILSQVLSMLGQQQQPAGATKPNWLLWIGGGGAALLLFYLLFRRRGRGGPLVA